MEAWKDLNPKQLQVWKEQIKRGLTQDLGDELPDRQPLLEVWLWAIVLTRILGVETLNPKPAILGAHVVLSEIRDPSWK